MFIRLCNNGFIYRVSDKKSHFFIKIILNIAFLTKKNQRYRM